MTGHGPPHLRKRIREDVVETALIVGLAALVVLYGGGAVGMIFAGVYRMMAAVIAVLAS